jgi:hypothetical protein
MLFTRTDWRFLKIALLAAIPLEIGDLWLLSDVPLKAPNNTWLRVFELLGVLAAQVMHYPAEKLLPSTAYYDHRMLTQAVLFVIGYIDFILLFFVVFLLYRILKWCVSTRYFGSA